MKALAISSGDPRSFLFNSIIWTHEFLYMWCVSIYCSIILFVAKMFPSFASGNHFRLTPGPLWHDPSRFSLFYSLSQIPFWLKTTQTHVVHFLLSLGINHFTKLLCSYIGKRYLENKIWSLELLITTRPLQWIKLQINIFKGKNL